MADAVDALKDPVVSFNYFKGEFLKAIHYEEKYWKENDMAESSFHNLIKSYKYWNRLLELPTSQNFVAVQTFSEIDNSPITLTDLVREIKKIIPLSEVVNISNPRNPRIYIISLKTKQSKDLLSQKLLYVREKYVVNYSWLQESKETEIKVSWIPSYVPLSNILTKLSPFFENIKLQYDNQHTEDNDVIPSGNLIGVATVKKGIKISDIDYYITVDNHQGFINIPNRPKICFMCDTVGHISKFCKTPFCKVCRNNMPAVHDCDFSSPASNSYALITKIKRLEQKKHEFDYQLNKITSDFDAKSVSIPKSLFVDPSIFLPDKLLDDSDTQNLPVSSSDSTTKAISQTFKKNTKSDKNQDRNKVKDARPLNDTDNVNKKFKTDSENKNPLNTTNQDAAHHTRGLFKK